MSKPKISDCPDKNVNSMDCTPLPKLKEDSPDVENKVMVKYAVDSTTYLFEMCKEMKHFHESPVIYCTSKDYSDILFNIMCKIRALIWEGGTKTQLFDEIVEFHLQWLHAISDIEKYKQSMDNIFPEDVYRVICFTVDAISARFKHFQRYIEKYMKSMTNEQILHMNTEIEIVEEMHMDLTRLVLEKLKCFKNFASEMEFKVKLKAEIDYLFNWVDKIFDGLSGMLCNLIHVNVPDFCGDLTVTLKHIVDGLENSKSPEVQKLLEDLRLKGKELSTIIRSTKAHHLEINKVMDKIDTLEDRVQRLSLEPSSAAVMALKNKQKYLEARLASLENLKTTVKDFHENSNLPLEDVCEEELCVCLDFYEFRIFSHELPPDERQQLVTKLCARWNHAIFGERSQKSIISILSAADVIEEYTDELGTYYIDKHSRKIYKSPDPENDTLYQPNENNELVPLSDDDQHIYFYDECGRYYINPKTRVRVYKAHATASEYMMDTTGVLLKIKEEREGVTYYYDNFGRYYINDDGKHIYREEDALSEYENDGLGNLVRLRSHLDMVECPGDAQVTEDYQYLKQTIGPALKFCLADIVMRQPVDPIKYLAAGLEKYRENIEWRDQMARDKELLDIERENKLAEEREAAERAAREAAMFDVGSEATHDSNLLNYGTINTDRSSTTAENNLKQSI